MSHLARKRVVVFPGLEAAGARVWSALSDVLPLDFVPGVDLSRISDGDAVLFLGGGEQALEFVLDCGKPVYVVMGAGPAADAGTEDIQVAFGTGNHLDLRLRGHRLPHKNPGGFQPLAVGIGDQVQATVAGQAVWVHRARGEASADFVVWGPPALADGEYPLEYCHGAHFLRLLPLIHFLRRVVGESGWQPPGLRACFMFDDPNLHWPTYGFLPFRELVEFGRSERFHVTMAMVPLDCWYADSASVKLFREGADQLSLLFHGSNHLHAELLGSNDSNTDRRLIAQAFRRIERFEARTGVSVSRSMAAPHGACSVSMMHVMLTLGMEGACISPWSLRLWNKGYDWGAAFGLKLAEITRGGFPVVPRFRFCATSLGDAVVSAFLDRPIIPVGHHDTMADGLGLIFDLAAQINRLGPVRWCNMDEIQRSNYLTRRQGSTLWVRPMGARLRVVIPEGVEQLVVDVPSPLPGNSVDEFQASRSASLAAPPFQFIRDHQPMTVSPGEEVWLKARLLRSEDPHRCGSLPLPAWALMRRVMCEVRDRSKPLVKRRKLDH